MSQKPAGGGAAGRLALSANCARFTAPASVPLSAAHAKAKNP